MSRSRRSLLLPFKLRSKSSLIASLSLSASLSHLAPQGAGLESSLSAGGFGVGQAFTAWSSKPARGVSGFGCPGIRLERY